jgi:hypothetical protein
MGQLHRLPPRRDQQRRLEALAGVHTADTALAVGAWAERAARARCVHCCARAGAGPDGAAAAALRCAALPAALAGRDSDSGGSAGQRALGRSALRAAAACTAARGLELDRVARLPLRCAQQRLCLRWHGVTAGAALGSGRLG